MNPPLVAALAYVRRGWLVIPLWPRQKRPRIPWLPTSELAPTRPKYGRTVDNIARSHAEQSEGSDGSSTA